MNVLVDSSVWIDFVKSGEDVCPQVAEALRAGTAAMTEPVWAEVWGGARGKAEENYLISLKDCCEWLPVDERVWEMATVLRRKAVRVGLNCPLSDEVIVACAKRHGAELLHADKHMEALLKL